MTPPGSYPYPPQCPQAAPQYPHPQPPPPGWAHGYAPVPPPKKKSNVLIGVLVAVVLVPVALFATCVGALVVSGSQASARADETLRVCGPSGDDSACAEITRIEDDEARAAMRAAVARQYEDRGAYQGLSARGTCSYRNEDGSRHEIWAEVEFESATETMAFRWQDDVLVSFSLRDEPLDCE